MLRKQVFTSKKIDVKNLVSRNMNWNWLHCYVWKSRTGDGQNLNHFLRKKNFLRKRVLRNKKQYVFFCVKKILRKKVFTSKNFDVKNLVSCTVNWNRPHCYLWKSRTVMART